MNKTLLKQATEYTNKQRKNKIWQKVVTVMAAIVVFCTTYALILPAITRESQPTCGKEEHQHTELCYQVTEAVLDCSYVTHKHEESCYDENGSIICELEEALTHTHSESCYDEAENLICEIAETPEHEHSEECYTQSEESILVCTIEEHTHDDVLCYVDPEAKLEKEEEWEATLPSILSGDWIEDLIEVAQSQIGYAESEDCVNVDGNGNISGATRYGIWYGDPYGKWDTMFISFCLHYAEIGEEYFPYESNAYRLTMELTKNELYAEAGSDYEAKAGDIVFIDTTGDGNADRAAIITNVVSDLDGNIVQLSTIEGDTENNSVEETSYNLAEGEVVGYGLLNEAYLSYLRSLSTDDMILLDTSIADSSTVIAKTMSFDASKLTTDNSFVLYTISNSNYYAIDGNGKAVRIYIDQNGNITADLDDPSTLFWTFEYCGTYENQSTYYIRNVSTGMYMHPYADSNTNHGAILSGRWESAIYYDNGAVKIRGARQNAYAWLENNTSFTNIGNLSSASGFYLGMTPTQRSVWLDGTNGGLMSLSGSPDRSYLVGDGSTLKLPSEWQSPTKYSYKLQGWYDIKNNKYYPPGAEITVTENLVFYADWVPESYDIGQFNSHTSDTVSTNDFITTKMFDYGPLFNVLSSYADVTVNSSGHSEVWHLITNGNSPYSGDPTLDFIFRDWDANSDITYPRDYDSKNTNGGVYAGIYNDLLGDILFNPETSFDPSTGEGIIGKQYLGTGDYLFQLQTDPTLPNYGYYYYDSSLHAASYNKSDQRFYVYDYLVRTSDSANSSSAKYSDFLPLNSPYVNTNGKDTVTYTYDGVNGEYAGTTHYQFDAKYNGSGSAENHIQTNYFFGMSIDMNFFLPDAPGTLDENGEYGNRDIYGKEMHFKFSGDDDVWVFVDGELVLDLGGIHGIESGDVNFSTGVVTVNGTQTATLSDIEGGDHVLTIYYLERGSSQSNCSILFNLAPRYNFSIQKEDVLTQEVLNGAEFSVFTDKECSKPAELWISKESHDNGDPSTNVFTVVDGVANMWGFSSGKTYYIRETKPPDVADYSCANGIICISLDIRGTASYSVEIIEETDENGNVIDTSNGFTVHGFRIDEENQKAFMVVTNAQDWVKETTTAKVSKVWNDDEDHTYDSVIAYLNVTDPDGTVRRIREITLSEENNWEYMWTSLPKYAKDGVTEIQYGVEEAYIPGYSPTIEKIDKIEITTQEWAEAIAFENNKKYILETPKGYLATASANSTSLVLVDEATAKTASYALWTATVNGNNVRFTNQNGYILTFFRWSNNAFFGTSKSSGSNQSMVMLDAGNGFKMYCRTNNTNYFFVDVTSDNRGSSSTNLDDGVVFIPRTLVTKTTLEEIEDFAYNITNTPLETETSLKVMKEWDVGSSGSVELYEKEQVTVKLFANGKDTGRTVTLSLKNGWTDTFLGLPYTDDDGNVIIYTVEESWETEDWIPKYGEVITVDGDPPTYQTTVKNIYRWGRGVQLPETGGFNRYLWTYSGMAIMIASLLCGYALRRKRERRVD